MKTYDLNHEEQKAMQGFHRNMLEAKAKVLDAQKELSSAEAKLQGAADFVTSSRGVKCGGFTALFDKLIDQDAKEQ